MSLRIRDTPVRSEAAADAAARPASPPALRHRAARWRDPRLWLGALLVLGSVVIGAKVLTAADDTVPVWQLTHDVPAGSHVSGADLHVTRVHFDDASAASAYRSAGVPLGADARALRDLRAGELLDSAAVSSATAAPVRQLPLGVGAAHAPADLRVGDHVQVWAVVASSPGRGGTQRAPTLVLPDVTVIGVGGSAFGASGDRQVLVALDETVDVGDVLASVNGSAVVLVRLAG